jgi:fused signal recognition particle receptor
MADRIGGQKLGLWARLKRLALTDVGALVRGVNAADLEQLERVLLEADFGIGATTQLVDALEAGVRKGRLKTTADLQTALADELAAFFGEDRAPGTVARAADGITVILMVGVNGVGKTTTTAKLTHRLKQEGRRVLVAAADTWRAGAIQQLQIWAERIGVPCVAGAPGGDPAAVAFDAIEAAVARGCDTVIVDTAGRLHTQDNLMDELRKVVRVVGRRLPGAPHEVLLVLDGTVGQNAVRQGREFAAIVPPTGIVVTKLDGSAKGGAIAALRRELAVPIRFVGLGEQVDDLVPFDPRRFAAGLTGSEG